jgi:hypothetical protein
MRGRTVTGTSRVNFQNRATEGRGSGEIGRVRLQTLILIRWIALAGQIVAILFVRFWLGFDLPLALTFGAVGISALVNISLVIRYPTSTRLSDGEAAFYLAFDTIQLGVLLFLTGGIQNPFAILVLAPVTISSTTLSLRSTISLGLLTLASLTLLAFYHLPLPWAEGGLALSPTYIVGIWTALALGLIFIGVYDFRIAEENRRMTDALAETEMTLAREQRLSALGGLAAMAAYELGSPLGTITLIASEMRAAKYQKTARSPKTWPSCPLNRPAAGKYLLNSHSARIQIRTGRFTGCRCPHLSRSARMAISKARSDFPLKSIRQIVSKVPTMTTCPNNRSCNATSKPFTVLVTSSRTRSILPPAA